MLFKPKRRRFRNDYSQTERFDHQTNVTTCVHPNDDVVCVDLRAKARAQQASAVANQRTGAISSIRGDVVALDKHLALPIDGQLADVADVERFRSVVRHNELCTLWISKRVTAAAAAAAQRDQQHKSNHFE